MSRPKRRQSKPVGPLQRIANRQSVEREADVHTLGPVVSEFTAQHGYYQPLAKTGEARHALINRGGTPLARWTKDNLLSPSQLAAIAHVDRLWRLIDAGPRLTANLDRTIFGCPGDGNMAEIEARDDLHRIRSSFHPTWWSVFENVCRFDEPAGVAGSALSSNPAEASQKARFCVCMVADHIYMRERLSY